MKVNYVVVFLPERNEFVTETPEEFSKRNDYNIVNFKPEYFFSFLFETKDQAEHFIRQKGELFKFIYNLKMDPPCWQRIEARKRFMY